MNGDGVRIENGKLGCDGRRVLALIGMDGTEKERPICENIIYEE